MAEKKYLDFAGLGQYDAKIKALIDQKDAATLTSAKEYANGLAGNYDAAGSAATAQAAAVTEAKGYTDTEVAKANAAASTADGKAVAAQGAAAAAQAAADKAQGEVDALETLVGTIPSTATATDIVGYVQEKTAGIATEGAMTELAGRVTDAEGAIDAIEADYLKAADKTELEGKITAEAEAREAADEAIDERLVEVEAFFKLAEGEQLDAALDTLVEIQNYITTEGAAADQMVLDIAANKAAIEKEVADRGTAISGVETAYKAADEAIDARLKAVEEELDGEGSISGQIADAITEAMDNHHTTMVPILESIDGRIDAAQSTADTAQDEVDALELVVSELSGVVDTKAAQADHEALDGRVAVVESKMPTLMENCHLHTNKTVLDGITAQLVTDWNDAVAKEHEHANKDVLDGITAALVSNWNAAEGNAKAYADGLVAEFVAITTGEIDSLFTTGA